MLIGLTVPLASMTVIFANTTGAQGDRRATLRDPGSGGSAQKSLGEPIMPQPSIPCSEAECALPKLKVQIVGQLPKLNLCTLLLSFITKRKRPDRASTPTKRAFT